MSKRVEKKLEVKYILGLTDSIESVNIFDNAQFHKYSVSWLVTFNSQASGGPWSNEQVADSIGPLDDVQFKVSTLARGNSVHCISTTSGAVVT